MPWNKEETVREESSILSKIPRFRKFVFCFVDPSSLVYKIDGTVYDQLDAKTIKAIAIFPRTELLLNFPLESILRCAGDYFKNPTELSHFERRKSNNFHGLKQLARTTRKKQRSKSIP
jgi:hypothetical protein